MAGKRFLNGINSSFVTGLSSPILPSDAVNKQWTTLNINTAVAPANAHIADLTLHRVINDSNISTIELWSSSKISNELNTKSDISHNHDDRYYTESEIDNLINIRLENINGIDMPVYDSVTKNKTLSSTMCIFTWSEANLSNNDWFQIGSARDAKTGHMMPFDGTITGIMIHSLNVNQTNIKLFINGSNSVIHNIPSSSSGQYRFTDTSLSIDFEKNDKLRLKNVGGSLEDTVISLIVQWRF